MSQSHHLDATFAALADPTRRAILARLASGEAGVMELAQPFAMSQPAISKHLKVLEHAGLISRGRNAQRRPCRLEPQRLQQIAEWIECYRRVWEENYSRLDDYLQELQCKELPSNGPQPKKLRTKKLRTREQRRDIKKAGNHRSSR
jgi:DNA-binding transcriptional ArsR family regulator